MATIIESHGFRGGVHFDPSNFTPSQQCGWRLKSIKYGVNFSPSQRTVCQLRPSNLRREGKQHRSLIQSVGNVIIVRRSDVVAVVDTNAGSEREAGMMSAENTVNLPELDEIISSASDNGIDLKLSSFGPFFSITATASETNKSIECGTVLGRIEGFIRPWIDGLVLHLDSVRIAKIESSTRSVFGVALRLGAAATRFGYDRKCKRAEMLAINDSDEYHTKLTRYYSRLGFRVVHEVKGGSLEDMAHMLVWGGLGTRMDGDPKELLQKWAKALKKQ